MATRTISTKLAVEGESQYRESMARINGEIKSLSSELKLVESQFQTNANSMEALSAKGDALNNLYTAQANKVKELKNALENAKAAEASYAEKKAELTAKIQANNQALETQDSKVVSAGKSWANQASTIAKCESELDKLRHSTEDTSDAQAELEQKISGARERMAELESSTGGAAKTVGELLLENKELNSELQKNEGYLEAAGRGVANWKDKLNHAEIKLNDLDAEIKLNDQYMQEARESSDGCATSIDRFGERVQSSTKDAEALTNALMAAGVVAALKATADALMACVDTSVEFESAMAGVSKTTDMADEELDAMGNAIQDLATKIPATASEIANVAEAAGQLGIAKEDILAFSEVMVNLGTATNLSSEEAASALAKFANVVNMSSDDYERLGSTIVALGNNFATTEADIVSMATRLASTGELVGLTEPEIMAVATALSSVGIEAEAGGSAISKLLKQFEVMVQTGSPQLQDFAAVAGMSAEEFAAAWGENAVQALSLFIDGLGDVDEAGGSSVAILDELGITEVRLSNAVSAMASSEGLLVESLNLANNAWVENTALSKEAATRYETTESKMQMLSNAADNVKIAIGDQLTPAIGELADVGTDALNWLADFVDEHDALVPLVTAAGTAIGTFVTGIIAYEAAVKAAELATKAFALVAELSPVTLAVTAVAALAAGLGVLVTTLNEDATPSVDELASSATTLTETLEASSAACEDSVNATLAVAEVAETYIEKLEELEATGLKTEEQQREYHNTLALLCQTVPELSQYIDLQNDKIIGGTEALRENTEAWKENATQQAYQEQLASVTEAYNEVIKEAAENSIALTKATIEAEQAQENYSATQQQMNALWEEAAAKANAVYEETGALTEVTDYLSGEYYALEEALRQYESEMYVANDTANAYKEAMDADAEAIAAAEAEMALAQEAVDRLTEGMDGNSQAAEENAEAQNTLIYAQQEVQAQIEELATAYSEAYESARTSIDGQIGLFDTFAASISKDTDTVEEMMGRWAKQTENLATYTENLKKAADYGVDQGLVASLSDGSAESAGYLATIIGKIEELGGSTEGMSEDAANFVDDFNASFARTQDARDEFAEVVAAMETDFADAVAAIEEAANSADFSGVTEAMEEAFANVGHDFEQIGNDAAEYLSSGIEDATYAVEDAAEGMATSAVESALGPIEDDAYDVGETFVEEIAQGVEDSKGDLEDTVEDMGDDVVDIMTDCGEVAVDSFLDEFDKISGKTKTTLNELKSTVSSSTSGLKSSMETVGRETINGMINGMNNRSGALYSTVRSIVNEAIRQARAVAAVASPSKKTTEIFEFVGDGMVVGLENRRKKVKETMDSVVSDAMNVDVRGKIDAVVSGLDDRMPSFDLSGAYETSKEVMQKIENHFDCSGMVVREEADIEKIARQLYTLQRTQSRSQGVLV